MIGNAQCAVSPQPVGEAYTGLEELNCVKNRLDNLVHRLQDKLSPVLTQPHPECRDNVKEQAKETNLGNAIDQLRICYRDLCNNLETIIERINI